MTALEFYELKEQPFGVTPDARYLFLTSSQNDALSSLIYGIESGCGLVALIARPGLGKTTLLYQTQNILRERARLVFLFQTISTPLDLLRALLSGLGVLDLRGNLVEMQIRLKELLAHQYRAGRRVVLVIDEAQNLEEPVLELVRMLSNFETSSDKLIQIILAGQPQLGDNIGSPELLQLRQRFSIFARLQPLTAEETTQYVTHRLRVAGYGGDRPLFTKDAFELITQGSEGIPRNINNLCFNALSLGCALKQMPIDRDTVRRVMADLDPVQMRQKFFRPPPQQQEEQRVITVKATAVHPRARRAAPVAAGWLPKARFAFVAVLVVVAAMFMGREWLGRSEAAQPAGVVAAAPTPAVSEPGLALASEPPVSATVDTPAPLVPEPQKAAADGGAGPATEGAVQAERSAELRMPPDLVLVAPGQTLLGICAKKFGSCSAQILQQIYDLNPSLSDIDHIETGQKLKIPVLAAQSIAPRTTP